MVADAAHEGECIFKIRLAQVIKEQAADTAWFLTVFKVEIIITPLLEMFIGADLSRQRPVFYRRKSE